MSLIKASKTPVYKPKEGFKYPWAFDIWEQHDAMVWHKSEYDLSQDVVDFSQDTSKNIELITNIMRLFTQNDTQAANGYATLLRIFKPFEVYSMLSGFNDREITHTHNYANFTETLGFSNEIYSEFLEIPVMSTKTEYMDKAKVKKYEEYKELKLADSKVHEIYRRDIARMLAVYAGGLEGISLMAQFAMLLSFQKKGKYPGLCTIVEWSIKDEAMHVKGNCMLLRAFIEENLDIWDDELKRDIYSAIREIVEYEHALIHWLNPDDKETYLRYVEYMADQALQEMGMKKNWFISENPIPFMEDITGMVLTDFFSGSVTEYSKEVEGNWDEVSFEHWKEILDEKSNGG